MYILKYVLQCVIYNIIKCKRMHCLHKRRCNNVNYNHINILQESQEASETSSLTKEYFTCTHWNAIFATVSNICPYKETDTISSNIEKSTQINYSLIFNIFMVIQFILYYFHCSIIVPEG